MANETTGKNNRISTFKIHIAQTPDDPFPRYALAMEYRTMEQLDKSRLIFKDLITQFPDYVPTYLMYGSTLVELGDSEEAEKVFTRGIEVSGRKRDSHAQDEIRSALDHLLRNR